MTPSAASRPRRRARTGGLCALALLLALPGGANAQETAVESFIEGARKFLQEQGQAIQRELSETGETALEGPAPAFTAPPPPPLANPRRGRPTVAAAPPGQVLPETKEPEREKAATEPEREEAAPERESERAASAPEREEPPADQESEKVASETERDKAATEPESGESDEAATGTAQAATPLPARNPLRTGALEAPPQPPHPGEVETPDWTASEIAKAKAQCERLLKGAGAVYAALDPIREGRCGTPAPIELSAAGAERSVAIDPPATTTCAMAAALAKWLDGDVQPAARERLGAPVVTVRNVASYTCRNRYGRPGAKISEHARANALDTPGFETADGETVSVLDHWSETLPPPQPPPPPEKAPEESPEDKLAARATAADGEAKADATNGGETASPPPDEKPRAAKLETPAEDPDTASSASEDAGASEETPEEPDADAEPAEPRLSPRAEFLREVHGAACLTFGTVLGPKANAAHANHFHLDMAEREYGNYCE